MSCLFRVLMSFCVVLGVFDVFCFCVLFDCVEFVCFVFWV